MAAPVVIPGGNEKGKPIHEASSKTLQYWAQNARGQDVRDAASAELAQRGEQPPAAGAPATTAARQATSGPRPAGTTALARPAAVALQGTFHDAQSVTANLQVASREAHLVAPAPACGALPVGCGIAISAVYVDPETETYGIPHPTSNNRGLAKVALDKISAAAGVSWIPEHCGRQDNGADPHYCAYRAFGTVKDFDGTIRKISGEVEIDLRDGVDHGCSEKELPGARKFILRNAESKAKNRAIRSLGVRTKYSRDELAKPFVVAKVQFTGHTDDPDLRRMFAEKTADAFLGGTAALYGAPAALPVAHRQAALSPMSYAPTYPAMGYPAPPPSGRQDEDDVPSPRPTPPQQGAPAREPGDDDHDPGFAADDDFPH